MTRSDKKPVTDRELPDADWCRRLRRKLLRWYEQHARDLPWRGTRDLYAIWVSEIMLQQTQVATVIDYYQRFLSRFPSVVVLASASEEVVLRAWEGLGYYRRARQLHSAAKRIVDVHGGQFPQTYAEVLALPGIGRYTAGAILSLGTGQRLPILEANTFRLYCRLLAFEGDPYRSGGQRELWSFAEHILPRGRISEFNQALMELGSLVCSPTSPKCLTCPLADLCGARRIGGQERIPAPKKKTEYTAVTEAAVVIRDGDRVLIRRCGPQERWAGLWDFPRFSVDHDSGPRLTQELVSKTRRMTGLTIVDVESLATIKHGVTRYRITLLCHQAKVSGGAIEASETRWVSVADLRDLPLNVTGRKLIKKIL